MLLNILQLLALFALIAILGYYWKPSIKFSITGFIIGIGVFIFFFSLVNVMISANTLWPIDAMIRDTSNGGIYYFPILIMCLIVSLLTGLIGSGVEFLTSKPKKSHHSHKQ